MNGNHPLISTLILTLLLSLGSACTSTNLTKRVLDTPEHQERRARLKVAEAMFAERCKKAGVFIHKKVEDVEGIFLMKIRPEVFHAWDQFGAEDPYGADLGGDAYIRSFLRGRYSKEQRAKFAPGSPPRLGYPYAEAIDPKDGLRYRYTGLVKVVGRKDATAHNIKIELQRNPNFDLNNYAFVMDRVLSPGLKPRYAVTYDDISTREDREYWIAGSSLKVIDLHTNEVLAERIGYLMDRGQGSGRSPWLKAANNACPGYQRNPNIRITNGPAAQTNQTFDFAESVLIPIKEDE